MGRKNRAIKKPPNERPVSKVKKATRAVTFNEMAAAFATTVHGMLLGLKGRVGGAQDYGPDGLFVCAVEALHTARSSKNLEDFLRSAAYAIAAALKASGAWDYPMAAPEEAEKPAEGAKAEKKERV